MRKHRVYVVAAVIALVAVGMVAGNALARSGAASNGRPAATTAVTPQFATGTAVKVKAAAVVNADGTLLRASTLPAGVSSVSKLSTGTYDIRFTKGIAGCAWFGNVGYGTFGGSTGPASITITGRAGTTNGLFVTTFSSSGSATDYPWMVEVVC